LRLRESIGPVSAQVNASLNRDRWQHLLTDVPSRLEAMDAAGIDVQVISVAPTQYHLWTDQVLAGDVAAAALEDVAAQCAQAPERLVGLTSVSLQHPALIGDQIQRAMTKGMRGIEVPTMVGDQDLSDRKLDPLWEAAEDQGAVVFIHPLGCQFGKRLHDHYLGNVIGQPL